MKTFKVGDRVRLKAEHAAYAREHGITGELIINRIESGQIAHFEGHTDQGSAFLHRLEHVPAPALIDPARKYRTRDGREVRIYATDGGESTEVHGAIKGGDGWGTPQYWHANGQYFRASESGADLIEVKPERSGWVNVYADDVGGFATSAYNNKEDADRAALDDRIACIHLKFRDGDGLEGK